MHWSTSRALRTIAEQRHSQLDAALDEALHRDRTPQWVRANDGPALTLKALERGAPERSPPIAQEG